MIEVISLREAYAYDRNEISNVGSVPGTLNPVDG